MHESERSRKDKVLSTFVVRLIVGIVQQVENFLELTEMSLFDHPVGLIDNEILYRVDFSQMLIAVLDELPDTTGCANDNVRIGSEQSFLFDGCQTADDACQLYSGVF